MKIITMTPNPALDVHLSCPDFVPGAENRYTGRRVDAGGKGINVSRALKSAGVNATTLLLVASENAKEYLSLLAPYGLSPVVSTLPGRIRENIVIHTPAGETILAADGFPVPPAAVDAMTRALLSLVSPGDFLVFSGSLSSGTEPAAIVAMLSELAKHGARLVLDSKSLGKEHIAALRPCLIKPNREEAESDTGCRIATLSDAAKAARTLAGEGASNVLLSLGADGAVLACENGHTYFAAAPRVTPCSAVGAGDSMLAGFLLANLRACSPEEALGLAVAFGTAAVGTEGTEPPPRDKIKALLPEIFTEKLS